MTAIIGGFGAALCWTVAMLCSSRASRDLGAFPTLAWVMAVGFVIVVPFVIVAGSHPTGVEAAWLFVAGAGNIVGLLFEYTAVRSGKVGIVAAIASTEGAVAALLSVFAGEPISAGVATVLALIATGIVLASLEQTDDDADRRSIKAIVFASGAALSFGVSLYSVGHVSGDVAFAWLLIPARLVGVVVITLPLAIRGTLRIARRAAPLVVGAGVAEVFGIASFAWGAQDSIGITSVLGSQFAAMSAVGAYFFFGERLRRIQVVGVAAIVIGVALLAVLRSGT
jgi:drug/metabolite transporter (DMT)-like permease